MICPNCGNNLNDESQFCDNCGTNLANNQNVQPEIQQNVEEQKIVSEQPVQQTPVENIQPMPQPEVQSTIESKTQNKPKKGNSALIIIIVIMLMCIVGLLLYIFVINKDKTKDENETETNNNTTTTTTKKEDEIDDNSPKLVDYYKKIFDQYTTNNTSKEITEEKTGNVIKINDQKQVEITVKADNGKISNATYDINDEKAKYITKISNFRYAILTEEGNIYITNTMLGEAIKIDCNYKFSSFIAVNDQGDIYRRFYPEKAKNQYGSSNTLIGITNNQEYILIDHPLVNINQEKLTLYYLGKEKNHILDVLQISQESKQSTSNENEFILYNKLYILIRLNGEIGYISSNEIENIDSNSQDFSDKLNSNNIKDENNKNIKIKSIIKNRDKITAITLDNKIYELNTNQNKITASLYNNKTIKNIEYKKSEENEPRITKITVEYTDGTKDNFFGEEGRVVFE